MCVLFKTRMESTKKFNVKYCVLLPIVLLVTIFLWAVPASFYGIDALTATQQRVIALFVFAALMWIFEIIPNWTTSLLVIVLSLLTVSNKGLGLNHSEKSPRWCSSASCW